MKLSHYSAVPVTKIRAPDGAHLYPGKPNGFWVSVDDPSPTATGGDHPADARGAWVDWKAWCESEQFALDRLKLRHRVTLVPDADLLCLETSDAVIEFERRFGKHDRVNDHNRRDKSVHTDDIIDWESVERLYDGIIIAPYQWSLRLDCMWYYSWDCASGCIWRPSAIQKIEVMP